MRFRPTDFADAFIIEMERRQDERGHFARTMCRTEFEAKGLAADFVQTNHSHNQSSGTIRGMHFQHAPFEEAKLVRCVRGAIYDVIVDLRPGSGTFRQWRGFELTEANGDSLYVPKGFAHGFLTLVDNCDVIYQVTQFYTPGAEAGVRYDDPAIGILWPAPIRVLSPKDQTWPLLVNVR